MVAKTKVGTKTCGARPNRVRESSVWPGMRVKPGTYIYIYVALALAFSYSCSLSQSHLLSPSRFHFISGNGSPRGPISPTGVGRGTPTRPTPSRNPSCPSLFEGMSTPHSHTPDSYQALVATPTLLERLLLREWMHSNPIMELSLISLPGMKFDWF